MLNPFGADGTSSSISSADMKLINSSAKGTKCLHEDGGKYCILEPTAGMVRFQHVRFLDVHALTTIFIM
jgi:hypothetical protein